MAFNSGLNYSRCERRIYFDNILCCGHTHTYTHTHWEMSCLCSVSSHVHTQHCSWSAISVCCATLCLLVFIIHQQPQFVGQRCQWNICIHYFFSSFSGFLFIPQSVASSAARGRSVKACTVILNYWYTLQCIPTDTGFISNAYNDGTKIKGSGKGVPAL